MSGARWVTGSSEIVCEHILHMYRVRVHIYPVCIIQIVGGIPQCPVATVIAAKNINRIIVERAAIGPGEKGITLSSQRGGIYAKHRSEIRISPA